MRFERIVINNYRQYEKLELSFPNVGENDLHIVIASNGIGKTNLLNAIDWCLYGEESHLGDKNDSLSICNLSVLERELAAGRNTATVSIAIHAREGENTIVFRREVAVSTSSKRSGIDKFEVTITPLMGNSEILVADKASEEVDKYLPRRIKQYFFFDGEQLFNYFGTGKDTTHVKDSIHEITQVNVVTQVRDHLKTFINDAQRELSRLNPATERLQNELEALEKKRDDKIFEVDELKKAVAEAEDRIAELDRNIAGMEHVAEDDKRYKEYLAEIDRLEDESKKKKADLTELVRNYVIRLYLYEKNKGTADYILNKEEHGSLPPDINPDLVMKSLKNHKCVVCEQDFADDIEKHMKELLDKFQVSSAVSGKLMEIKNDVIRACEQTSSYEKDKNTIYKQIREIDAKIKKNKEVADELYKRISSCSSIESISEWMEERKKTRILKDQNTEKIGTYKAEIKSLEDSIELKNEQIKRATEGEAKCEELKNELTFAKSAFRVVDEIANEVTTEMRERMESETFSIFEGLIWKRNTYGSISLDEDYKLRLFHKNGDSCLGSCSAAERELLALAFTLAMHRISKHDSLLFIDTPVGRVSDDNRECFAKSLIEVSKEKQLILAFTPSEYSVEISKYFDNYSASKNNLLSADEQATFTGGR